MLRDKVNVSVTLLFAFIPAFTVMCESLTPPITKYYISWNSAIIAF
jgi:hypothetical protein